MDNFDFLKNFEKRMENNATSVQLLLQCASDKKMWSTYELNDICERYNVIFSILVYLAEKEYYNSNPTIDDINEVVVYVLSKIKKRLYSEGEILPLTKFLIEDILQNGGKMIDKFPCFNFEEDKCQYTTINFIKSYPEDGVICYKLTPSTYEIVYNSLELAANGIDYEGYKLTKQSKNEKYGDAIQTADKIKHIIKQKNEEAQDLITLLQIDIDEEKDRKFREMKELLGDTFDEQFKKYDNLKKNLLKSKKRHAKEYEQSELKEEILKVINDINTLDKKLKEILHLQKDTIKTREDLIKAQREAVLRKLNDSILSKFSFKDEIFSKILNEPDCLININRYLNPLFFSMYDETDEKLYSILKCCDYDVQEIMDSNEVSAEENTLDIEAKLKEELEAKREILNQYRSSLDVIIDCMIHADDYKITLKEIKSNISNEKYEDFAPNVEIIKDILIKLTKLEHVDLVKLRKSREGYVEAETSEFLINKEIIDLIDDKYKLTDVTDMYISSFGDEDCVAFNTVNRNDEYVEFICTNLMFNLKKEQR